MAVPFDPKTASDTSSVQLRVAMEHISRRLIPAYPHHITISISHMREMKLNEDAADSGDRIPSSWLMRISTRVAASPRRG